MQKSNEVLKRRIYKLRGVIKNIPTKLQPGFTKWSVDNVALGYNGSVIATIKGQKITLTPQDLKQNNAITFNVRKLLEQQLNEEAFDEAIRRTRAKARKFEIPELTRAQKESLQYNVDPLTSEQLGRFEEWLESSSDSDGTNKKIFYHDFGAPGVNKLSARAFIEKSGFTSTEEWLLAMGF